LPTTFHPQCDIPGPTNFQILTPAVTVPPGQCRDLNIRIDRPTAMISVNKVGCYEITFENMSSGQQFSRGASVWDTRDSCSVREPRVIALVELAPGLAQEVIFQVQNTGGEAAMPFEIRVEPADMEEGNSLIGVGGQEVGEPVQGETWFADGWAKVVVEVEAADYDPFRFYNITLVANPGEGETILDSVGVRAVPAATEDDGVVDGDRRRVRQR
jgi:hypothetical protein